jgi:ABC-type nitrate/sulfonate/bicarbonate transport system ATPase subunit
MTATPVADAAWSVHDLWHAFLATSRAGHGRQDRTVPVLEGLSLSAEAGEFVAVLGPSGCGKSTVLRVLAGLLVPDRGQAEVAGAPTIGRPGACALQPQRDSLLPWRRCLDNAILGAVLAGVPADEARTMAMASWDRFGLTGYEHAWPATLSGGMRQRLALLRAFLTPRPVILLDEPFGALDAITRRDLQVWLEPVWAADRRSVVLVTHDVDEALLLADRVVVLSDRPARVLADVALDLPRPRHEDLVDGEAFVSLRRQVLAALRHGHRTGTAPSTHRDAADVPT